MTEPAHWSLGYFAANGYTISVFCPKMHGRQIDLDRAIERFGADFKVVDLRPEFLQAFRCQVCGTRGHSVTIEPPTGIEQPVGALHPY